MKNLTYILDVGSSKISLLACYTNRNKTSITTEVELKYDGFMDGEFFSTDQVREVVYNLVMQMKQRLNKPVTNIHIGVPGEFVACVCKRVTRSFVPSKKVTEQELEQMFDGVGGFGGEEYITASFSPLKFELDGVTTSKLSNQRISQFVMDCSYVLVKKKFVELMQEICNGLDIKDVDFIEIYLFIERE